jgi:FtsP/CotA-like multicopper oxidase with cupredoxin domain
LEISSVSIPDRRTVLRSGLAAAALGAVGAAAGCTARSAPAAASPARRHLIDPRSPQVAAAEAARHATGTVQAGVAPEAGHIDLGGPVVATWSFGGQVPGPEIRVRKGQILQALLVNQLPVETTVHWHGVAIRNDMDGVPGMTQAPVPPGREFTYSFAVAESGTYWYHPHVGVQLDRGLYGPLIVEDPSEPADYDHDWTVVLDDWIDGTGYTPDRVLDALRNGMGGMSMAAASPSPMTSSMNGMSGTPMPASPGSPGATPAPAPASSAPPSGPSPVLSGARSALLGGDAGDVRYPWYLINGRVRTAPRTFSARPGQRARIRFINAAADTSFRVALGGHQMTVTHTDGYPVAPVRADALLIGMGERYDVQVTLYDGVFPLTALAEGKKATALALVRTGAGEPPPPAVRPAELHGALASYGVLRAAPSARLPARKPDATYRLRLTGGMARYDWGINGQAFDMSRPGALQFLMAEGQRVRVIFANTTTMYHPMHIHGHTFQLGPAGPRKDTVIVRPGQQVACDFDAANPGQWMTHCHNLYHAPQGGMMAMFSYQT